MIGLIGGAALGAFSLLSLPVPQKPVEKPPYPVVRLEAAGPYLLVLRQGVAYPYSYTLVDTSAKKTVWEARDACCAGPPPWDVLLSPAGTGVVLLYPDGQPQTPYKLLPPGKAPVIVTLNCFQVAHRNPRVFGDVAQGNASRLAFESQFFSDAGCHFCVNETCPALSLRVVTWTFRLLK